MTNRIKIILVSLFAMLALPLAVSAEAVDPDTTLIAPEASAPEAVSAMEDAADEEVDALQLPAKADSVYTAVKIARAKLEAERLYRLEIWGGNAPIHDDLPARAEIVLAVWRHDSQSVNLYLADKQGSRLWVKSPGAPPMRVTRHARLYSTYAVEPGHPASVVGVLYPTMIKQPNGSYQTNEVVHIPSTREMFIPEIYTAGSDYLSSLVADAFDELRRRGIRSRAFPDRLLADAIDPYLVKSVVVIEHSNHQSLMRENDPELVLGAFYVNLALNEESSFSDVESRAGALGIVQFIPSTYALFVRNRPDLGLIPDFREGMADHRNAIIAEIAYFDDSLRLLPDEIQQQYLQNPALAADFLAAAYNGGITRVLRAYASRGSAWDQYYGYYRDSLRRETVNYVAKLRKVYAMLQSGVYATPSPPVESVSPSLASSSHSGSDSALSVPEPASAEKKPQQLAALNPLTTVCFGDGSCVSVN